MKKNKKEDEISNYLDDILILTGLIIIISVCFIYNTLLGLLIIGILTLLIGVTLSEKKK